MVVFTRYVLHNFDHTIKLIPKNFNYMVLYINNWYIIWRNFIQGYKVNPRLYEPSKIALIIGCTSDGPENVSAWSADHARPARSNRLLYLLLMLYLQNHVNELPSFQYMGGDFNIHSKVWDPDVRHHWWASITLLEIAADLDLEWSQPANPGPTFISHNKDLCPSVINLMFYQISDSARLWTNRDPNWKGPTDHIPLTTSVIIDSVIEGVTRRSITCRLEAEKAFIEDLRKGVPAILSSIWHDQVWFCPS